MHTLLLTLLLTTLAPGSLSETLTDQGFEDVPVYEETQNATNIEPKVPKNYDKAKHKPGKDLGQSPNTLTVEGVDFPFEDLSGNTGVGEDAAELKATLDQQKAVQVGMNGIRTFFGHYYNYGTSVFNPLDDQNLLKEGSVVSITDNKGETKTYEITQVFGVPYEDQYDYFYNKDPLPYLAYFGNGEDMVYIQYCRWDIELGYLKTAIGYRVD